MDDIASSVPATPEPQSADLKSVSAAVHEILRGGGGGMMGARIGAELRRRGITPAAFGFPNLSALLRATTPDVRPASSNGSDFYWALTENEVGSSEPSRAEVWRALASPGSSKRLAVVVSRESGSYRLQGVVPGSTLEGVGAEWAVVPPIQATLLRSVATQFAESLPEGELRSRLSSALEVPTWWTRWPGILKGEPEVAHRWSEARHAAIKTHISEHLHVAGVDGAVFERAAEFPAPGPLPSVRLAKPANAAASARLAATRSHPVSTARELLEQLLPNLDEADIRSLRVPLGVVADLLGRTSW